MQLWGWYALGWGCRFGVDSGCGSGLGMQLYVGLFKCRVGPGLGMVCTWGGDVGVVWGCNCRWDLVCSCGVGMHLGWGCRFGVVM